MDNISELMGKNICYWNKRSKSYSEQNKEELNTELRQVWKGLFLKEISNHFHTSDFSALQAVDMGTGPGFFSILLEELGCRVTGVDASVEMLSEAQNNAKEQGREEIRFINALADATGLESDSVDIIVSRNLTWNLEHPKEAYKEWFRILKKGGMLCVFDANWYRHLFFEKEKVEYETDRRMVQKRGFRDFNSNPEYEKMDVIAKSLPLSNINRPKWDCKVLKEIGFLEVSTDENIWERVWNEEEQVNFSSTPMFYIKAVK